MLLLLGGVRTSPPNKQRIHAARTAQRGNLGTAMSTGQGGGGLPVTLTELGDWARCGRESQSLREEMWALGLDSVQCVWTEMSQGEGRVVPSKGRETRLPRKPLGCLRPWEGSLGCGDLSSGGFKLGNRLSLREAVFRDNHSPSPPSWALRPPPATW